MLAEQVDGLLVFTHGFAVLNRAQIIVLAARHRLPTLYGWRDFVDEGGLMSYGPDIDVLVRSAASYVDRIIRGEAPRDLPVQQPARLHLVINLTLQLRFLKISESMGNDDSKVVDADSVD